MAIMIRNIRDLAYELYKDDWKRTHGITQEMEIEAYSSYLCERNESAEFVSDVQAMLDYSFDDYIVDNGYSNGIAYVCKEEFLQHEYMDPDYMNSLLDKGEFARRYDNDIIHPEIIDAQIEAYELAKEKSETELTK